MKTEIRSRLRDRKDLFGVFGFGSFFRSDTYNDIDLLVVVNDVCESPLKEFYEVKEILDEVGLIYDIPIDITYLSYTEYARKPLLESNCLVRIIES